MAKSSSTRKVTLTRNATATVPHPHGGTFHFFALTNGIHVSVLDDEYPAADDFEIYQREPGSIGFDGLEQLVPGTEQRAANWAEVHKLLDELEGVDEPKR